MRDNNIAVLKRALKLRMALIAVTYQEFAENNPRPGNPWKESRIENLYGVRFREHFRGVKTHDINPEMIHEFHSSFKDDWFYKGIFNSDVSSENDLANFYPVPSVDSDDSNKGVDEDACNTKHPTPFGCPTLDVLFLPSTQRKSSMALSEMDKPRPKPFDQ